MTLKQIKEQILAEIEELDLDNEELTDDEDIALKLNHIINKIQIELSQIKRIPTVKVYDTTTEKEFDLPSDFYQIKLVDSPYRIVGNKIRFETSGEVEMEYYKFPQIINEETDDSHKMEITLDCLVALVPGVIAELLKMDPSQNYRFYTEKYIELKNQLRLSDSSPSVYFDKPDGWSRIL